MKSKVCLRVQVPATIKHDDNASKPKPSVILAQEEAEKLQRLRRNGVIILIDQANIETCIREDKGNSWRLSYYALVKIIARDKKRCNPGPVLATYLVCSKGSMIASGIDEDYFRRNDIIVRQTPDERMGKEKGVDCTLVRTMTQEFEGIAILRCKGESPPRRTFCVVAGDFDYVDVVTQALEAGCNVEIWFWTEFKGKKDGYPSFSQQWINQNVKGKCESSRCGCFKIRDLCPYLETLTRKKKAP